MVDTSCSVVITMPPRFQDIVKADDIALDIHIRVVDIISHTCLRGEVDHNVEVLGLEDGIDKLLIRDGALDEDVITCTLLRYRVDQR